MTFENYIKPELLILVVVLYVIGLMLKNTMLIKDKFIPLTLGVIGVALSLFYVVGTEGFSVMGVFTGFTQGVLVAGASVYANQLFKQSSK